jgi:hypothetical protein
LIGAVLERPGIDLVNYSRLPPVTVLKQTPTVLKINKIFCFYVDEKIKLKVLTCSCELLTISSKILKILPVTRFKDPKGSILTLKMHTNAPCDSVKSHREAACDKLILEHFPCSQ